MFISTEKKADYLKRDTYLSVPIRACNYAAEVETALRERGVGVNNPCTVIPEGISKVGLTKSLVGFLCMGQIYGSDSTVLLYKSKPGDDCFFEVGCTLAKEMQNPHKPIFPFYLEQENPHHQENWMIVPFLEPMSANLESLSYEIHTKLGRYAKVFLSIPSSHKETADLIKKTLQDRQIEVVTPFANVRRRTILSWQQRQQLIEDSDALILYTDYYERDSAAEVGSRMGVDHELFIYTDGVSPAAARRNWKKRPDLKTLADFIDEKKFIPTIDELAEAIKASPRRGRDFEWTGEPPITLFYELLNPFADECDKSRQLELLTRLLDEYFVKLNRETDHNPTNLLALLENEQRINKLFDKTEKLITQRPSNERMTYEDLCEALDYLALHLEVY